MALKSEVSKMSRKKSICKMTAPEKLKLLDEKFSPLKRSSDIFFCWLFRGCKDE
jgi:hypothetical protein